MKTVPKVQRRKIRLHPKTGVAARDVRHVWTANVELRRMEDIERVCGHINTYCDGLHKTPSHHMISQINIHTSKTTKVL